MLISERTMYLEVTDDVFVTTGPIVDTLTIRQGELFAKGPSHDTVETLRMDGRFTDSKGKTRQLEVGGEGHVRRFALTPGWPLVLWRIRYDDTDDGKTHASSVGTDPKADLGPYTYVSSKPCIAKGDALAFDRTLPPPDVALVTMGR